jgi:histidyl-tRNA synthetase
MTEADVIEELTAKGMGEAAAREALGAIQHASPSQELQQILDAARALGVPERSVVHTPMLARGLDYYTGPIFEVAVPAFTAGSLAGGGRYDGLIEQLGGPVTPATGIAFGFDRVVEAAQQLDLVPTAHRGADVLVTLFGEATIEASLNAAAALRADGLRCEVYPALDKMGKQLKLANQKGIPAVVIVGPDEQQQGRVTVRDMASGDQQNVPAADVVAAVRKLVR